MALPGLTRPGIRITTAPLVRAQVRWALRQRGIRPFAVVAGYLEDLLGRWGDAVNVIYSTDDHVAGAELMGLSADRIRAQERLAAAHADVVVVVSPQLAGHWAALGSAPPVLIPNGSFPAYTGGVSPAPVVSDMPGPVVGLIGQLTQRIDLGMLTAVADAGYSLLLVGPYDPRWEREGFAALTARPNVRYAGRVPAEAVPSYLASIDVGLIPYSSSAFNRASFPMKTLEYFSAGLPVVSTDLPGSRWLRDSLAGFDAAHADQLMALTSDPAEFVAAVRRMASPCPIRGPPFSRPRRSKDSGRDCAIKRRSAEQSVLLTWAPGSRSATGTLAASRRRLLSMRIKEDWHADRRSHMAAGRHENAAKSHRKAAEHHGKGEHDNARDELEKARGHSKTAHEHSESARRMSHSQR